MAHQKKVIIGLIERLGDIVACEPVSRYARGKYPDAHLSWAVVSAYRELIDTNPHIDETIVMGCTTDWIRLTKHVHYDEIIDLHVNNRICEHCRIPLVKTNGNPQVDGITFFSYGALLEAFSQAAGLPKISAQPRLYLGQEHWEAVDALALPDRYCVIHRFSSSAVKDWSDDGWLLLTEWIMRELELPIVEVGGNDAGGPAPLVGDLAIDLRGRLSILQTAEVIRRARFFIGLDSGPTHIANAVRTPGVVLLGPNHETNIYTPFTGYYASDLPEVKRVRNLRGAVKLIPAVSVIDAVSSLHNIVIGHDHSVTMPDQTISGVEIVPATSADLALVENSDLFDRAWYIIQYHDNIPDGSDPLDHFITYGGRLGFAPGANFDSAYYLQEYPDVVHAKLNPLVHYLQYGQREGRKTRPLPPVGFVDRKRYPA